MRTDGWSRHKKRGPYNRQRSRRIRGKQEELKKQDDKGGRGKMKIMWGFRGVFSFCLPCLCYRGDNDPTRQRLVLQRQQVAAGSTAARLWDLIICGTETFPRLKDKWLIKKNNSPTPLICGQYPVQRVSLHMWMRLQGRLGGTAYHCQTV